MCCRSQESIAPRWVETNRNFLMVGAGAVGVTGFVLSIIAIPGIVGLAGLIPGAPAGCAFLVNTLTLPGVACLTGTGATFFLIGLSGMVSLVYFCSLEKGLDKGSDKWEERHRLNNFQTLKKFEDSEGIVVIPKDSKIKLENEPLHEVATNHYRWDMGIKKGDHLIVQLTKHDFRITYKLLEVEETCLESTLNFQCLTKKDALRIVKQCQEEDLEEWYKDNFTKIPADQPMALSGYISGIRSSKDSYAGFIYKDRPYLIRIYPNGTEKIHRLRHLTAVEISVYMRLGLESILLDGNVTEYYQNMKLIFDGTLDCAY